MENVTQVTQEDTSRGSSKVVETPKKTKYQQRMEDSAKAAREAYANLREMYDDPTDEQVIAALGNNIRGYQWETGNKAGNWGTAFGSNALWGTLNPTTRKSLENEYLESKKKEQATPLSTKREELLFNVGAGDNVKGITRGDQMDVRNWGSSVKNKDEITPEEIANLNKILEARGLAQISVPTDTMTIGEGENATTVSTPKSMSLYDMMESIEDADTQDALAGLGFFEDGAYALPHNETFEEKLARRERERERMQLEVQQKALERQRLRLGLSDLAAGIGDMIKASGGATVTPRDYQRMYDSLTAQHQKNFDGYLARLNAAKAEEKAKAKLAEERAYQEKLFMEKYSREDALLKAAQERKDALLKAAQEREDAQRIQDQEWELDKIRARGAVNLGIAREKNKQKIDKFNNARMISYDGVDYTFAENTKNEVVYSLLGIVRRYFTESNGFYSMLSGIENSKLSEFDRNTNAAIAVLDALESLNLYFTDEDKSRIKEILYDYSKGRVSASASSTQRTASGGTTPAGGNDVSGGDDDKDDGSGGMFDKKK